MKTTNNKVRFSMWTINFHDVRRGAIKAGWLESSDMSPNDFVDAEVYTRRNVVPSSDIGIDRCVKFIKCGLSYYGQETVIREELLPDCDGLLHWVETGRWLVDDEGVAEHRLSEIELL